MRIPKLREVSLLNAGTMPRSGLPAKSASFSGAPPLVLLSKCIRLNTSLVSLSNFTMLGK